MKKLAAWLMAGLMCLSFASAEEAPLGERLEKIFKRQNTVGAVLYVAKGEEILYEYCYGYADRKAQELVSPETYFRTASVTKLVSGIHVMQLVEQGKLALDASIGDYLGYEVKNLYYPKVPVTLRHLMSHTCALRPYGSYRRTDRSLQQLLDAAGNHYSNWYDYAPGSKYNYSNFGAGVMGALVESVTSKNVNDSITESLFQPLGIDAALHPTLLAHPERIVTQYTTEGASDRSRSKVLKEEWDASVDPQRHYRITIGSLWIRGRDLCRLGIMMCQNGILEGKRMLQESTVQAMMADQKGLGYVTVSSPYGLCVNREDSILEGRMVYGHQGMSNGVLCNLYWEPESQLVFALMTNGSKNNMNDHVAVLARRLFAQVWEVYGE